MSQQTSKQSRPAAAKQDDSFDALMGKKVAERKNLTSRAALILGVDPTKLCALLRNVWTTSQGQPELTDQEMFAGISIIGRFELDPIAREVTVTRDKKGRLLTIIGIDGWIKILDRTDHYDGFEVEIHEDERGRVDWVETKIHSTKRSRPTPYRAFRSEYEKMGGFVANTMPIHMLRIFSLRHAARLFVPLGAHVVTPEEAAVMMRGDEWEPESPSEPAPSDLDELSEKLEKQRAIAQPNAELKEHLNRESGQQADSADSPRHPKSKDWFDEQFEACRTPGEIEALYDSYAGPDSSVQLSDPERKLVEQARQSAHERIRAPQAEEPGPPPVKPSGMAQGMIDKLAECQTPDEVNAIRGQASFLDGDQKTLILYHCDQRIQVLGDQ